MAEERLVVKSYNPAKERQRVLLVVGLIIGSLFAGLMLGGQWFEAEMVEKRQLELDMMQIQQDQKALQLQVATAELNSEVDRRALETVRLELSSLQGKLAEAEEELGFYRNLLQQEGAAQGLLISGFTINATRNGELGYRLVVQQRAGKLKTVKVTASVDVEGVLGEKPKTMTLADLDPEQSKKTLSLQFRYFYVHDGALVLPEGFEPERITVKVWPAGQSKKAIERQFDWQVEET